MLDQKRSTVAGNGSARTIPRTNARLIPTICVPRTSVRTLIRRPTSPPPKSPAPHATAAKSPNTSTDAGPNGPPSAIDECGLGLRPGVGGDRRRELDDDIGDIVVPVGGRQVDHLEVGREVPEQLEGAARTVVVERHERVVEDERRPLVARHQAD